MTAAATSTGPHEVRSWTFDQRQDLLVFCARVLAQGDLISPRLHLATVSLQASAVSGRCITEAIEEWKAAANQTVAAVLDSLVDHVPAEGDSWTLDGEDGRAVAEITLRRL